MSTIPLTLYIHFPWCISKCPYCDFNSHALKQELPEHRYVKTLLQDLEQSLPLIWGRPIQSIFMGGGTPSLFSPSLIAELITTIKTWLPCHPDMEITMEANPGTVEQQRFHDYRTAGVNRLSIGIQSFEEEKLKILGRIHNSAEAIKAVTTAQQVGFDNINLDLMFGLPQQSMQQGLADLKQAILLQPQHISWYQLTLEPNTYFHRFPPQLPPDENIWQLQQQGQQLLQDAHFNQYEISAYAKPNFKCHHNMNYWQFGDYLGIGAGAHSKLTQPNFDIIRFIKAKSPKDYLLSQIPMDKKTIPHEEKPLEFMMNHLRLNQAMPFSLFTATTGLEPNILIPTLTIAKTKKLLDFDHDKIQITALGKRFLNNILELFLP